MNLEDLFLRPYRRKGVYLALTIYLVFLSAALNTTQCRFSRSRRQDEDVSNFISFNLNVFKKKELISPVMIPHTIPPFAILTLT